MGNQTLQVDFYRENGIYQGCLAISSCPETIDHRSVLSTFEAKRYVGFPSQIRKQTFFLGRLAAKYAIRQLTGQKVLSEIDIDCGVFDFPVVKNSPGVGVSISHSSDFAFAAAYPAQHPLGVDVENLNRAHDAILKQLTEQEHALLASHRLEPTYFWCAKESLSKVLRTGLTTPLNIFEIKEVFSDSSFQTFHFTHFHQYKAICFPTDDDVFCLCLPKKSKIDEHSLVEWLQQQ